MDDVLRKAYERLKEVDERVAEKFLNFLNNGVGNLTLAMRFLQKSLSVEEIKNIFKNIKKSINFYLVNIDAGIDQKPREIKSIEDILSVGKLPRNLFLIVATDDFLGKFKGVFKVLSSLLGDNPRWLIATLASDDENIFWHKLEEFLLKEYYFRPPLMEILPIFHACKEIPDKVEAIAVMDRLIREKGAVLREWSRISKRVLEVKSFISKAKFEDKMDVLIRLIIALIDGAITFLDFFSIIVSLSDLEEKEKVGILLSYGCKPEESSIEKVLNKPKDFSRIISALRIAQRKFEPEFSLQEIFGIKRPSSISSYLLNIWLESILQKAIIEIDEGHIRTGENIRMLLKLAIALSLTRTRYKSPEKSLIIRYLLSLGRRILDSPITLTSLLLDAVRNLKDSEIAQALLIQRFLEVHGEKAYFALMENIVPREKWLHFLILQIIFSSDIGVLSKRMMAYALSSEKILAKINMILMREKVRARGLTVGIPWEIRNASIDELEKMVKEAKKFFRDAGVEKPDSLRLLEDVLKKWERVKYLGEKVKFDNIVHLGETYRDVSILREDIERIQGVVRVVYKTESIPPFGKILKDVSGILSRFSEEWEKRILEDYPKALNGKIKLPLIAYTLKKMKKMIKERPLVLVVIDGLRIDDFNSKLRPLLLKMGFKPVEETIAISLIPSITSVSRRSIFGGLESVRCLSNVPRMMGCEMKREDELLKRNLDPSAVYIHGPFGTVFSILDNLPLKLKNTRLLAVVLSELEKAAHGATEAFLARISTDYAEEIARVIKLASKASRLINKEKPYVIVTADHGLEAFTKFVEPPVEVMLNKLKEKDFLETIHLPEIRERYVIIPLKRSEDAQSAISLIEMVSHGQVKGILASKLGYHKVGLKLKVEELYDAFPSDKAIVIFPEGNRKFFYKGVRKGRVVFHGGISPSEMLIPFSIFR